MKKLLISIKNIILWSYDRGTWQYDLLCLLIIVAILLIPGKYFGDRDRPLRTSLAASEPIQDINTGTNSQNPLKSAQKSADLRHWDVEATKLNAFAVRIDQPDALKRNPHALLELYLREKVRVDLEITRFDAQYDSRGNIISYRIWFQ